MFIATVVNIAATLVKREWSGFWISHEIWTVIILVVAGILVVLAQLLLQSAVFSSPVAWAYFGIYKQLNSTEGFSGRYPFVEWIALIGITALLGLSAIQFYCHL